LNDVEDRSKDRTKDLILTSLVRSVLILTVVTVLVSALKALAEVVAVLVEPDIVRVVTERRVLVSVGILIVKLPAVVPVRLSGVVAFLVTTIDRILEHLRSVRTRVVVIATAIVAIVVDQVVIISRLLQPELVGTNAIPVTLLVTQIRASTFSLEFTLPLKT
jgi:hypothetical protein